MTDQYRYKIKSILIATLAFEVIFWALVIGGYLLLDSKISAFRIENKQWFILFAVIPILTIAFFISLLWKNKAIGRLSDSNLLQYLIQPISSGKTFIRFTLLKTAITFFITALLNPQFGEGTQEGKAEGIEIAIALDISNSMRALDLDPKRSRLKIAKISIERLLKKLRGDKISLIIFAGESFVQVPLTGDYGSLKSFLNAIDPEMISNQGTNISDAIQTALSSFDLENNFSKTIIVISDGEDHEGAALKLAKEAYKKNVIVSAVGMGTANGTVIPNIVNGKKAGLKKDENGKTVTTRINIKMLRELAKQGGGTFVQAKGSYVALEPLLKNINSLEKTEFDSKNFTDYKDQFQWFIGIGLVFLLLFFSMSEKSKKMQEN